MVLASPASRLQEAYKFVSLSSRLSSHNIKPFKANPFSSITAGLSGLFLSFNYEWRTLADKTALMNSFCNYRIQVWEDGLKSFIFLRIRIMKSDFGFATVMKSYSTHLGTLFIDSCAKFNLIYTWRNDGTLFYVSENFIVFTAWRFALEPWVGRTIAKRCKRILNKLFLLFRFCWWKQLTSVTDGRNRWAKGEALDMMLMKSEKNADTNVDEKMRKNFSRSNDNKASEISGNVRQLKSSITLPDYEINCIFGNCFQLGN